MSRDTANVPGDLLDRRARRRFHGLRCTACFVLVVAALAAGLYVHGRLSRRPLWTIRSVEVEGNRSVSTAELLDLLRLRPGAPLWRISSRTAERLAREMPRLEAVTLSWRPPRDLRVTVRERESVVRVLTDPPCELAGDGVLLEPAEALDPADLPLLTGSFPAGQRPGKKLAIPAPGWEEILAMREEAPEFWKVISEIHYAGGRDFQIVLREGRKVVLWEAGVNRELKARIPAILAELRQGKLDDAVLDLRFRDQVVVRLPEGALADSSGSADGGAAPAGLRAPYCPGR